MEEQERNLEQGTQQQQQQQPKPVAEAVPETSGGSEGAPSVDELQKQLEVERRLRETEAKKRLEAEKALQGEKQARSKLQREQMTKEEQLAEQQKELEVKARAFDLAQSGLAARQVFASAGFAEADIQEGLDLVVSEDGERSKSLAEWITGLTKGVAEKAAKAEREKVLKEMPTPPGGKSPEVDDPFLAGFKKGD